MSLFFPPLKALLHVVFGEVQYHPCVSVDITQNINMILDFWDAGSPPYWDVKEQQVTVEELKG